MRAGLRLLTAVTIPILFLYVAIPHEAAADTPGVLHARELTITAVVEKIDYAAHTVNLRGPAGNIVQIAVDTSVRNFDQVKRGDTVQVTYLEAVAIQVMKPENVGTPGTVTSVQVAPLGDKPGIVSTRTEQDSVVVQSIDYAGRLATLQMPDGSSATVEVDPNVQNFTSIQQGDHIVVRRTQAVAISVHE